jgi:DNA-binding SARP family transcriptional activator
VSGPPPFRLVLLAATPRVETAEGAEVNLPAGKPLALLAYLHLVGDPVPRDALAGLLWPGSTRERARGSMRHALWTLRQRVSEELFRTDDPVQLADDLLTSDVAEARAALARGDLETALGAWETPPFGEFQVADAPEWSRWAESVRFDLEHRLGSALAEAGESRLEEDPGGSGVELLEQAVRVQPDRLQHHVLLVEARLDQRDFDAAATALSRARLALDDPSSVSTLDRLEKRRQALEGGGEARSDEEALRLDFVGRTEEFAAILRRWREARSGNPAIGLILGDPGVGKTRMAEELARVAEAEEARTVQVKAEDSERPIEWGLLAEVIQRLLRLSGAAGISPASDGILRSLMPSLSLAEAPADDASLRTLALSIPRANPSAALSDALMDLITAVSEDAPLLLVVDDLHWADTESRTVLARVSTRLDRASALLLFTCRTEVEEARVRKTLTLLGDAPNSTTLELAPWSFASMAEALRGRMQFSHPGQADAVLHRIHRTSRGNPLFILELLKVFLEEEILVIDPTGEWVFHTDRLPPNLNLPGSVRALVDRQLDQLSKEAILVAAHMARIGHATSPRVLGLKTGLGTSAVTNGIGELLARRMVRWEARDSLVFVHDELRAAVARRYQLHVGLTAGGGAQWSFFRTAVVASLAILLLGAALYAFSNPDPLGSGPWGGGIIEAQSLDGGTHTLRLRAAGRVHLDPAPISPTSLAGLDLPGSVRVESRAHGNGGHDLHVVHLDEGEEVETWVGWVSTRPRRTFVSPDHRYVGAVLPGAADTVQLLAMGGRRVHEAVVPEVLDLDWCGPNGLMILAHGARGVELVRWQPGEGGPAVLPLPTLVPGGALACSPDGRGLLLAGVREGRAGIFLLDLLQETVQALSWPGPGAPTELAWTSRRERNVPVHLQLDAEPILALGMGGQRLVDGVIVFSGGTRRREPLAWSVEDSTVAVVSPEGRVTALAPGRTRVRARWGGWMETPLEVEVTYVVEAAPILQVSGTSRGDHRVPLEGGAAVTVEFALDAGAAGAKGELCLLESRRGGGACVRLSPPGAPGAGPALVKLSTRSGLPPVRRALDAGSRASDPGAEGQNGTPAGSVSGALIVDAEGWVRLYMEGDLWLEAPARVDRGPGEAWLLRHGNGALGSERVGGVFQGIRVWEGERRGRPSIPFPS